MSARLLIVDDDRNLRGTLEDMLEEAGYAVAVASNGREALALVEGAPPGLVLCDWRMPDLGGEAFLRSLAAEGALQAMPVIIMTAYGSGPSALGAMQLGAYDFLTKPLDRGKVLETIARALRHVALQREVDALRQQRFAELDPTLEEEAKPGSTPLRLVGGSPAWIEVFKSVGRVAQTGVGVLLLGESGTGKEVVARSIHANSTRHSKPFVVVNCAALPPELLESELFGHERGSFTGAVGQKIGKFEAAHGGTLFLDEIGELPLALQPKLLRVLQEHTFERIGSNISQHTDVRVLAATNRQLEQEVAARAFRADLFYRLNTYAIHLPPLRERVGDIRPLADYFLERYATRHAQAPQGLTEDALRLLTQYSFPGNVRELEHLIERAAVQAGGRAITADEILGQLTTAGDNPGDLTAERLLQLPFHQAVALLERRLLETALQASGGNKSEAARRLGMNRRLLYEKMEQYALR